MYDKLNITENHLQVLSLFTGGLQAERYIREVERQLKISPRTAQLILADLEVKGVLESETKGKIRAYRLQRSELGRRYLLLAEEYKALSFLGKNRMAGEVVEKITPFIKGMAAVFGSYAQGTADKGSDLDVFVVGSYDRAGVRKVSGTYGLEISVKCYPQRVFEKEFGRDILIREIMKNHVLFLNAEQFMRRVFADG